MADVIADARKPAPVRMLANVCTREPASAEVFERKRKRVAGTTGLEPATSDVTGRRSNQLSYVPALVDVFHRSTLPRHAAKRRKFNVLVTRDSCEDWSVISLHRLQVVQGGPK